MRPLCRDCLARRGYHVCAGSGVRARVRRRPRNRLARSLGRPYTRPTGDHERVGATWHVTRRSDRRFDGPRRRRTSHRTGPARPSLRARLLLVVVGLLLPLLLAEIGLRLAGAILPGDYQTASFAEAHPEFGRRNRPGAGWKKTSEYTSWIEVNSKGLQRRRDRVREAARRAPHPGARRLVHVRRAGQPERDVHPAARGSPQRRGRRAAVPGAERRLERLGDRERGRSIWPRKASASSRTS